MIILRVMESSGDYNNHNVTIKRDDETVFSKQLKGFNNTPLASKLEKLCINKQSDSIESLDCYGYKGELENMEIILELVEYNKDN